MPNGGGYVRSPVFDSRGSSGSSGSAAIVGSRLISPLMRPKIAIVVGAIMLLFLLYLLLPNSPATGQSFSANVPFQVNQAAFVYNNTYPMSAVERTVDGRKYKIAVISDPDTTNKDPNKENQWMSYLIRGSLSISSYGDKISVNLDEKPVTLKSQLSQGGRGMELSELVTFNGKLYTVDDRTGVIYEVAGDKVFPWVILPDGDGKNTKGMKGEWMAVKDQHLFVGGLGKEWTTITGELVNLNPQWIKVIGHLGAVHHVNWVSNYNAMRNKGGFPYPGYMIHESGVWSNIHQRWFFLPRRASTEKYEETADEHRATNLLFTCNEFFTDVRFSKIGSLISVRGYSSFKFVPGTNDQVIVALKTEEDAGKIATFVTAFNIDGKILMPDKKFADIKYEGIEFV
ncbi:soluble calcium-activated nucleotidase 1 [Strongylocentrotus purpuratus]|uniref:Soluble calcium-activated nucleotidase 1 n=1 Tax=Strongylocentrotus purpuratus TaxID=7668 RepID=A0A7M7RDM9_STRPU|nr:soluble calcium-activated nucleotidase 1 [Strongylocentrotus purpuratus]